MQTIANAAADGDTQRQGTTSRQRRLTLDDIGAWLSVIAAIAAPLYFLGLVVLAIQIAETYKHDFATAWYVASLASSKTVLAVAFKAVLNTPILGRTLVAVFGVTMLAVTGHYIANHDRLSRHYANNDRTPLWGNWREVLPFFVPREYIHDRVLFLLLVIPNAALFIGYCWLLWRYGWRFTLAIMVGFCFTRFIYLVWEVDIYRGRSLPLRLVRALALYYLLSVLFVVLLSGVRFGSPSVQLGPPPLPYVELITDPPTTVRGQLIAHADGYWHVLVEPNGEYRAIADGNAKSVISPSQRGPFTPTPSTSPTTP